MQPRLFPGDEQPAPPTPAAISTEVLNPAQYAAVTHGSGPLLVIAGAGSGKTRTLVFRMAHLLEQDVPPESILLLTFTRRAAQEMLWRAGQLTGQSCRRVMGGTFHATANILLRQYGHHLGLGSGFTIIDRGDAEGIINLLKSSLGMSGAGKRFPSKRVVLNLISGAINKATTIDDLVFRESIHLAEFIQDFHTISDHYRQFKRDHGLLDYDDLLVFWRQLLAESAQAREELSSRFRHILVDEYQDTNQLQAEIVRLLASHHGNVMAVGDDAQSIYSFRGADFHNIMRFADQFPGTRIVKLEENYRSTQPILQLTNAIIANAEQKYAKTLFTSTEGGSRPLLVAAASEAAEARYVADVIEERRRAGVALDEIAVLFRSGFHSFKLEIELASRGLEFDKRGGLKLTESAHIKDLLAFFRVLINPWDNLSWNRILIQLEKVGPKTVQKILAAIRDADEPLTALAAYRPAASMESTVRAAHRHPAPARPARPGARGPVPGPGDDLLRTGVREDVLRRLPQAAQGTRPSAGADRGYGDLQAFVDDTAWTCRTWARRDALGGDDEQRLILSTIHSAKGWSGTRYWSSAWPTAASPTRTPNPVSRYEEERRLLYVAATAPSANSTSPTRKNWSPRTGSTCAAPCPPSCARSARACTTGWNAPAPSPSRSPATTRWICRPEGAHFRADRPG